MAEEASSSTALAVERTVMAADRSLMAWVRTGLSLISFGFTIYKFLEYERAQLIEAGKAVGSGSRAIGLIMIGMGILSLLLGTIENVVVVHRLRGQYDIRHPRYSLVMAGVIAFVGIVLFMGILFKLKGIASV